MQDREKKNCHKLKYRNIEDKKTVLNRLAVIEGQIRGISNMVDEERYCSDILIQISSVESSLKSLADSILENHMRTCMTDEIKKGNLAVIDEITTILKRNRQESGVRMKDDLKRNSVKIILSLIILVIASIAFIFLKPESMASRFKLEYESLNGQKTDDGREYMEVNINNDNKIVYADYKTIFDVLDGTGVIYFGFPECPWCRNAVPVLLEAAEESSIIRQPEKTGYTSKTTSIDHASFYPE